MMLDDISDENLHTIERDYEVMKQLGDFTTYHEPETSSAAVYFHNRREFDGMIGYHFVIEELPVDKIHPMGETSISLNQYGVHRRRKYAGHKNDDAVVRKDKGFGLDDQKNTKTYHSRHYDGYPEILVIVSWDVEEIWTVGVKPADRYMSVVSKVISLFNGVDMLYSKLEYTNIQINIAGIIIGMEEGSFTFLDHCYCNEYGREQLWLDVKCVNLYLRQYLFAQRKKIFIDSYDLAIFLTAEYIVFESGVHSSVHSPGSLVHVSGVMETINEIYEVRKVYEAVLMVGTIAVREKFDNYPTIAHEIAHSLSVKHDEPPYFTTDRKCCSSIMKATGSWCNECLSWSTISEATLYLFFSSPNCCGLINKPQSLHPTGRREILTADEQCQCYGYESAKQFEQVFDIFCRVHLQCKSANNQFHSTVIPMDGTPCGSNKVCWQKNCEDIQIHKDVIK